MNYIDVHCHLDGDCYGDIRELMDRIRAAGVKKIIAAGYDLRTSRLSCKLSAEYDFCYFTAGFHPTELKDYSPSALEEIARLAQDPKCVAIGEIGLDYHYGDTDKEGQRAAFIDQLRLADGLGLPVEIHSRNCAEDMLNLLKENKCLLTHGALLHCYSYSAETALEMQKLGLYFSFGGTSTWKGSKKARRTIAALDEDRLLTETDSPYLSPQSKYGSFPNTPESIPEILACMAEVKGVDQSYMCEKVWNNAHALFKKL